jgi:hypothetical protein
VRLKDRSAGTDASDNGNTRFAAWAKALFKHIGPYSANFLTGTPKQGTRMLKSDVQRTGPRAM